MLGDNSQRGISMVSAYELIDQIKDVVDEEIEFGEAFETCRAYEIKTLPMPLDKIYFCFSLKNITLGYVSTDDENVRKTDVEISMNCYYPATYKAYHAEREAESIMNLLMSHFSRDASGYTVAGAVYDSTVRAYKVEAVFKLSSLEH